MDASAALAALAAAGVARADLVGLAVAPGGGAALATGELRLTVPVDELRRIEDELRPRWVVWSPDAVRPLVKAGLRVATCWDLAAVHRLLFGGWRAEPGRVWAVLHDLPLDAVPVAHPVDLFHQPDEGGGDAVRPDGHLDADWAEGGWAETPERAERWAGLALVAAARQQARLADLAGATGDRRPHAPAAARVESTAELLCVELSHDGLPVDRDVAEALLADVVGPRPRSEADVQRQRAERDALVLAHAPDGTWADLRSPGQVKSLLRRVGIEVPDTRAWRLEALRDEHPLVDALLAWRKAERVATTYGYTWLDEHVGADGRLRGAWTGSDGAAGRMTASAGLHNLPADMRRAVVAEPGHVFVRADLGQIEPRVLAAVSGDRALAQAARADDLYPPLAEHLGVDRATAKVAMLGAMYGQTSGHGAQVQRRLRSAYPVAMAYLEDGDRSGRAGRDVRTYGGRLVRMGGGSFDPDDRGAAGARGRYGRNALVQGAAAELFKMWAVTVRARGGPLEARIVLCLHDELLVHVPTAHGDATAALVEECLQEAASRWAPGTPVRFVADIQTIPTWSAAKD